MFSSLSTGVVGHRCFSQYRPSLPGSHKQMPVSPSQTPRPEHVFRVDGSLYMQIGRQVSK
jgi:hypothetical protein